MNTNNVACVATAVREILRLLCLMKPLLFIMSFWKKLPSCPILNLILNGVPSTREGSYRMTALDFRKAFVEILTRGQPLA